MGLMKMFFELCGDTFEYFIMSGIVAMFEVIHFFEEHNLSKNTKVKQSKKPSKDNIKVKVKVPMFLIS